ncbi:MAG: CoA pyrophosphatase, partial [Hyphomicrobiales bacterium]|nr:CoA pyrophosphatase [Hyphomicrobiales bacterium]
MTAPTFAPFGVEDLRHRARRLLRDAPLGAPFVGHDDPRFAELVRVSELRPASVLVGIVDRRPAASVLLIRRADHLAKHSGQIAFPGGKIDASDAGP